MVARGAGSRRGSIGRRAGAALLAIAGLASCGLGSATVPLVFIGADQPGFKMLRPAAAARACGATIWPYGERAGGGLLETAIADLLAEQREADVVRDAQISWRGIDLLVVQVGCVSVRGDVGRAIPTVKLPMLGDHGGHGRHDGAAPQEEDR